MKEEPQVLNLSDLETKRRLLSKIGALQGLWEIKLKQRKRTRTLDQNAYYWAAVVTPFTEWLREAYGEPQITTEQAHEMLKVKILGLDTKTIDGLKLEIIPRSKTLNTKDFSDYIEGCAKWLAEFCNIVVIPSEMFHQGERLGFEHNKQAKSS